MVPHLYTALAGTDVAAKAEAITAWREIGVAGVTLLERAVRTLREAGVQRVIVVVGHAGEPACARNPRGLDSALWE